MDWLLLLQSTNQPIIQRFEEYVYDGTYELLEGETAGTQQDTAYYLLANIKSLSLSSGDVILRWTKKGASPRIQRDVRG
jgi:hypothetical protein